MRITTRISELLASVLLIAAIPAISFADTVNVSFADGTQYVVAPRLSDYETEGDDMDGMLVTAYFGASSSSGNWADDVNDDEGGEVVVSGKFSLTESGDTWASNWTLTNLSNDHLTRLILFGPPGNTLFDIDFSNPSTPHSENGRTFTYKGGSYDGDIDVLYTDIVSVIGEAPVGDLYATIDITFRGTIPGGGSLIFQQDTDNVVEDGTITPIPVGDIDQDGDVDGADFALFAVCLAGPDVLAPPPGATPEQFARADLDGDGDVDVVDFAEFQTVFGQ